MEQGDRPHIPRPVPDADIRALPLGPLEGFVFTRMDGRLDLQAIAEMTGQSPEAVREAVERLVELGAAVWVDGPQGRPPAGATDASRLSDLGTADTEPPPPGEAPPGPQEASAGQEEAPPGPQEASAAQEGARQPAHGETDARASEQRRYDPAELEASVDLPEERQIRILDTYGRLDELDYYGLLGVPRTATKQDIRTAYFNLSKVFHPDTLFGKNLGSFKPKMEKVFHRLTEAYETLGRKKKRQAYDAYLGMVETTEAVEQRIVETHAQAEALERRSDTSAEDPRPAEAGPTSAPPAQRPSREAVRRQLFGRRLSAAAPSRASMQPPHEAGRGSGPEGSSIPPSLRPPEEARATALQGLARSLARSGGGSGTQAQLDESLAQAKRAESTGDLTEAVNALRLAVALDPDAPELRAEYDRVRGRLARSLVHTYRKQALYEEEIGHWGAAAVTWLRVIEGQPDAADPHRRAALALLQSAGDLRQARDLAQRAADLEPENPRNRIVLGQIYKAAGMRLNALRELQEAAKLDPEDEIVKNLLHELGA